MQACLLLAFYLVLATSRFMSAQSAVPTAEYEARREAIRQEISDVLVVFGRTTKAEEELRTGFFQESDFYYLSGWTEPDAVMLLTKTEEEIFLPPRNEIYERYYGHKTSAADANATSLTGFRKVLSLPQLEPELFRLLGTGKKVQILSSEPESASVKQLLALRPDVSVEDFSSHVEAHREIKSVAEQQLLQRAADVSVKAHLAVARSLRSGWFEYQAAAAMEKTWGDLGCERPAYAPIVASGPNAVVLHYATNKRQMQGGDLAVIDAAAECSAYAADITRTLPVGGRFSSRQREIYDVVLKAQQAAVDAVKPGMVIGRKDTVNSLMKIAYDYINTHGKDTHGQPLGAYVLHGLSHHIGLDVHDPGDIMTPLKPGMVISIEPGVYIRDEGIGVRIEDMVLVTETGHKVLTEALPKEAAELERLMNQPKR
jgi:Xaa-Pro aminopeptidase